MPQHIADLPPMVILTGANVSNAIGIFDDATALTIASPAAVDGVITVETDLDETGVAFVILQSGGVDVTLPAGKATVFNKVGWRLMRVSSAAIESADRTFRVTKSVTVS